MKKIWFDVEFLERDITLDTGVTHTLVEPISFGFVDERDRTALFVSSQFNLTAAVQNEWLRKNVLDKLPPQEEWMPLSRMRAEVLRFIGPDPVQPRFYHLEQDAVLLRYLLTSRFMQTPENIVAPFYNIAQRFNDLGAPSCLIPRNPNVHDALSDAIWTKAFDKAMDAYSPE